MPRTTTRAKARERRVAKAIQVKVSTRKAARKLAEPVKFIINGTPVLR